MNSSIFKKIIVFGLFAIICWIDFVTPSYVIISGFYLLPIALAAFYSDRWTLALILIFSAVINLYMISLIIPISASIAEKFLSYSAVLLFLGGFGLLALKFESSYKQLKDQSKELSRLALRDQLTNLPNRYSLNMEFEKAIARTYRSNKSLAVVMIDLDGFKPVNDMHGHKSGDMVLQIISERLRNVLRKTDFIARLGGDEFVLLIENCATDADIFEVLNKVETSIKRPVCLKDEIEVTVNVSAGFCLYPEMDTKNPDQLLRYADQALYQSKTGKATRLNFWTEYKKSNSGLKKDI